MTNKKNITYYRPATLSTSTKLSNHNHTAVIQDISSFDTLAN